MVNKNIVVDNILLNYYFRKSRQSKKTVVFLHGWGVDSRLWFKLLPLLGDNYDLYFIDLPGFGKSQTPKDAIDLDKYSDLVVDFSKKIGLKKFSLVGHSFGGRIAIKIASKNPGFLDKLVLVDSAGIKNVSLSIKSKQLFAKIIKPFFVPSFMQAARQKIYHFIGSEYLDISGLSKIFSKVVSENLLPELSKIKKRTLLVWGEKDSTTSLKDAFIMKDMISDSKLVILEKSGHFSFLDEPEKFAKAIIDFV